MIFSDLILKSLKVTIRK